MRGRLLGGVLLLLRGLDGGLRGGELVLGGLELHLGGRQLLLGLTLRRKLGRTGADRLVLLVRQHLLAGLGLGLCGQTPLVGLALLDGGLERTQADLRRSEVAHLIDLEQRVHVGLVGEDLGHLIGGDGVQAAAEGVELHEFETRVGRHEMRRRVEPRMVGPLVGDAQRHAGDGHLAVADVAEAVRVLLARVLLAFRQVVAQMQVLPRLQFADRILREHDHAERADRLRDAVVDLGVDVVRAPGEHDAPAVVLLHVGERLETFLLHVVLEDLVLGVRGLDRGLGLLAAHVRPRELLDDAVDHELVVGEVEVRVHVADAVLAQFGHVRADHHRVVGHDRAVVVVVRTLGTRLSS